MGKRWHRPETAAECGKRPYESRELAIEAIVEIRRRKVASRNFRKLPQRAYFCRTCDAWHVTSRGDMPGEVMRMLQERL